MLLPGIRLKTSPTDYFPIQSMRLRAIHRRGLAAVRRVRNL
jgi:hypothetical protein